MAQNRLVVLHVASIKNDKYNGVCVAVPNHVYWQGIIADTALLNITNIKISNLDYQLDYDKNKKIDELPEPYNEPDIVVFHEVYHMEYLKISNQLIKKHIPYVIIPHGCLTRKAQKYKKIKKTIGNLFLFNTFIKRAEALQCLSMKELSETHFSKNKFIASNGTIIPATKKTGFNNDKIVMTFIGRLEPYIKGFDLLFEALSRKKEVLMTYHCILNIYGPDAFDWKKKLEQMIIDYNIDQIVKIYPPVSGNEKEKVLLETDFFVQTSRSEGMPMGILEALSYGVPCLVTEGTTLGDIIREYKAGFVSDTSSDSITETLEIMVNQKDDVLKLSQNAIKLIQENYEWNIVSEIAVQKYGEFVRD